MAVAGRPVGRPRVRIRMRRSFGSHVMGRPLRCLSHGRTWALIDRGEPWVWFRLRSSGMNPALLTQQSRYFRLNLNVPLAIAMQAPCARPLRRLPRAGTAGWGVRIKHRSEMSWLPSRPQGQAAVRLSALWLNARRKRAAVHRRYGSGLLSCWRSPSRGSPPHNQADRSADAGVAL